MLPGYAWQDPGGGGTMKLFSSCSLELSAGCGGRWGQEKEPVARSRPTLPLVLITILALGLVAALAAGVLFVLLEPQPTPSPETAAPLFPNNSPETIDLVQRTVGSEGILALHVRRYKLRLARWPDSPILESSTCLKTRSAMSARWQHSLT